MGIEVSLKTGRRKKSTQVTASSHWFQNTTVHLCELEGGQTFHFCR